MYVRQSTPRQVLAHHESTDLQYQLARLKAKGLVAQDDHVISTLVPCHLTDAEKSDLSRFDGTEVLQWHRNGGVYKAGDRVRVADLKAGKKLGPASTFAVYRPAQVTLAVGDKLRVTGNGWDKSRKHRMDNGSSYTVAGFEKAVSACRTAGWWTPSSTPT